MWTVENSGELAIVLKAILGSYPEDLKYDLTLNLGQCSKLRFV